ncbi:MAG: SRPBCC family protein [Myxococcota bacterium]
MLLFMISALAASPWADKNADVAVERTIPASPAALAALVHTTQDIAALMPEACVVDWEHTEPQGPARVTYQIKSFKRRLTARLTVPEPNRRIELDHEGKKGFVTRFLFTEVPNQGTRVQLTTFLNAPPWPLRKYYFEAVRPDWVVCYEQALTALEDQVR